MNADFMKLFFVSNTSMFPDNIFSTLKPLTLIKKSTVTAAPNHKCWKLWTKNNALDLYTNVCFNYVAYLDNLVFAKQLYSLKLRTDIIYHYNFI